MARADRVVELPADVLGAVGARDPDLAAVCLEPVLRNIWSVAPDLLGRRDAVGHAVDLDVARLLALLERFFALYASVNSFTQTVASLEGQATPLKRFPPRVGAQALL